MIEFGFHLGAAFQIRDDILNLVGDPGVYGKEPLGDLREGKRTLMLIHLLAAADPADRRWLVAYLARDRPNGEQARRRPRLRAHAVLREHRASPASSRPAWRRSAMTSMDAAFAGLDDSPARRFIALLVPFMIERAS